MTRILSTSIASLIISPALRMGAGETDAGGPGSTFFADGGTDVSVPDPDSARRQNNDTSDDVQADFSSLTGGDDDSGGDDSKSDDDPDGKKKAAAEKKTADEKKAAADKKAADEKKAAAEKKEPKDDKKAAADKKAADEKKAAADKKEGKGKKEGEDEEDDEIDKHKLPENAASHVKQQFKGLRDVAKRYKSEAKAKDEEITQLKQQVETAGKDGLPEDVKAKLSRFEELEKFEQTFLLTQSPAFTEKYEKPIETSKEALKGYLTAMKMPEKLVEQALKEGENWKRWEEAEKMLGPVERRKLQRLRTAIVDAGINRDEAIESLRAGQGDFAKQHKEGLEKQEREFWEQSGREANALLKEFDAEAIFMKKPLPKDATEDQKKAIEEHNNLVTERSKEIAALVQGAIVKRDPAAAAKLSFNAYRAQWLESENEELRTKAEELEARVAELEETAGRARTVGRTTHRSTGSGAPKKEDNALSGMSAEDAVDGYFNKKA